MQKCTRAQCAGAPFEERGHDMDGRKSSMFRKSADRALIGEVNYSLRFCPTPVCNLPTLKPSNIFD